MSGHEWVESFPGEITVSDQDGIILEMNKVSEQLFAKDGGLKLIGTNMLDCHPEPSRSELVEMLKVERKKIYTTEKKGVKKLIVQTPWYRDGVYAGFVELSIVLPPDMLQIKRD